MGRQLNDKIVYWLNLRKQKETFINGFKGFQFLSENLGFIEVRFYTDIIATWAKTSTTKYAPSLKRG